MMNLQVLTCSNSPEDIKGLQQSSAALDQLVRSSLERNTASDTVGFH